jgi:hypothetical protein
MTAFVTLMELESHGQLINSVLDGVLPFHATSSGGSHLVVELLIEQQMSTPLGKHSFVPTLFSLWFYLILTTLLIIISN